MAKGNLICAGLMYVTIHKQSLLWLGNQNASSENVTSENKSKIVNCKLYL